MADLPSGLYWFGEPSLMQKITEFCINEGFAIERMDGSTWRRPTINESTDYHLYRCLDGWEYDTILLSYAGEEEFHYGTEAEIRRRYIRFIRRNLGAQT